MFTGIVRAQGRIASLDGGPGGIRVVVEAPATAPGVGLGDSVAINGCCLTAVAIGATTIAFDAVPETLSRTSLSRLAPGIRVNLEPALRAGDPMGGHVVQGHVDAVGRVRSVAPEGEGRRIWFDVPEAVLRYCVEKGSIAIEGVSLTIAALDEAGVAVAFIPHTLAATTIGSLVPADEVNLEADVLAKYVERLVNRTG